MFDLTFWGARGSLPRSGPKYNIYGGATSCVEVVSSDELIIFDAGTGLYDLGLSLKERTFKKFHLFLSHLHFDHILGLPFFQPLFNSDVEINIYAPLCEGAETLESFFNNSIAPPVFPVKILDVCSAKVHLHPITYGQFFCVSDDILVKTMRLNHPGGACGFRLEASGRTLCYITDNEHVIGQHDQDLIQFVSGAQLLIYDAMFDEQQHKNHQGWGHSTWQEGIHVAREANVDQLALYHHHPDNDDVTMHQIENDAKARHARTFCAKQGKKLTIR